MFFCASVKSLVNAHFAARVQHYDVIFMQVVCCKFFSNYLYALCERGD